MGWISDIISGDDSAGTHAGDEDPVERARQLRRGVGRAAAALEARHPELARSADEAADRLVGRLPDDAGDELALDAVERLDRLHFDLLRVDVTGLPPGEAGVEEDVEAVLELADRAPGRPGPNGGSGGGDSGEDEDAGEGSGP